MMKSLVHQKTLALSTALFLALSSGAIAQSTAGSTTIADIERAGYTNVSEVAPTYDESTAAFQATAPDGAAVTIEIQQGTGEWLVVRAEPRSVVTTYRAGEAPAHAMPIGDTGTTGAGTGMQMETESEMMAPAHDTDRMDSPMEMESDMDAPMPMQ